MTAIYSDVIVAPIVTDKRHAAQKPVEVYINLLTRSVQPGDTVLDPFAGSGTIFEAASHLQCQAIGWDSDPMCIALCEERLHHETNPIN